jgi:hypothetical protein
MSNFQTERDKSNDKVKVPMRMVSKDKKLDKQ